jgi:hypothetical protein
VLTDCSQEVVRGWHFRKSGQRQCAWPCLLCGASCIAQREELLHLWVVLPCGQGGMHNYASCQSVGTRTCFVVRHQRLDDRVDVQDGPAAGEAGTHCSQEAGPQCNHLAGTHCGQHAGHHCNSLPVSIAISSPGTHCGQHRRSPASADSCNVLLVGPPEQPPASADDPHTSFGAAASSRTPRARQGKAHGRQSSAGAERRGRTANMHYKMCHEMRCNMHHNKCHKVSCKMCHKMCDDMNYKMYLHALLGSTFQTKPGSSSPPSVSNCERAAAQASHLRRQCSPAAHRMQLPCTRPSCAAFSSTGSRLTGRLCCPCSVQNATK